MTTVAASIAHRSAEDRVRDGSQAAIMPGSELSSDLLKQCDELYKALWDSAGSQNIESGPLPLPPNHSGPDPNRLPLRACPVCQEDSVKIDGSTVVCISCGVEIDDIISDRAEWHNFEDSNGPGKAERCTQFKNSLYVEGSLSTGIAAPGFNSSRGRKLLCKLQSWQMMPSKERTLKDDCDMISYVCAERLPTCVVRTAHTLLKMVEEECRSRGESHRGDIRAGLIASVVLNSSKINKYHVSHKELADWFEIEETYVTQGNKIFFRLMCHKIQLLDARTTHSDHINKFCTDLGLSQEVRGMAHEITNKVVDLGILRENTPGSIAAACIFFVVNIYGLSISRKLVSKQCKVSEATISKAYNKLTNYLEHLL